MKFGPSAGLTEDTKDKMKVSESVWSLLQVLREAGAEGTPRGSLLALRKDYFEFVDHVRNIDSDETDVVFSNAKIDIDDWSTTTIIDNQLFMIVRPGSDHQFVCTLRLYVPLCAASFFFPNQSFVIEHMAQTLDGKISTEVGNSKWIGNDANLTHAHRLRALVDGVIVGGVTARQELPSLDVRHVSGRNPTRIIFGNSFNAPAKLPVVTGMKTIQIRAADDDYDEEDNPSIQVIHYDGKKASIPDLLQKLRLEGIHSILLEGGPTTLQSFLSAGAVNFLQLHIAPILFGSGKSVLSLPVIKDVDDAIRLKNTFYVSMGDGMMITGQI